MGRNRRRKDSHIIELIAPLGGLVVLGMFFSPQLRQLFGALLYLILALAVLAVIGLIIRAVWRHSRPKDQFGFMAEDPIPSEQHVPRYHTAHDIAKIPDSSGGVSHRADKPLAEPPLIRWNQELLSKLEWKRFEDVVTAYVKALGHDARTTRIGADGGVDIELLDPQSGKVGSVIQCKAWNAYRVGVKPMRELLGVMAAAKIAEGGFFTTGVFTSEAREFALQNHLDPVDGAEFLRRIHQLPADQQASLLALATEGDFTTPTCPSCGVKMLRRTAGKERSEGSAFWGCRNYPRCRSTLKLTQA